MREIMIKSILHISDTHGLHRQLIALPEADVLVHSGDFTMTGTAPEAIDFVKWLCGQPHRHKIFIAGNHDTCLFGASIDGLPANCHYLCNSGVIIEGIKFYGVPMFAASYDKIPANTDIIITHEPPHGILDFADGIHYGSTALLERVRRVNPRYHLFGHIHAQRGAVVSGSTTFVNGAAMAESNTLNNDIEIRAVSINS